MKFPIIGWAKMLKEQTRPDVFANIARSGINVFMTSDDSPEDGWHRSLARITFHEPIQTKSLTLKMHSTHGGPASLFCIRAYSSEAGSLPRIEEVIIKY